jgi:hypothetical protein
MRYRFRRNFLRLRKLNDFVKRLSPRVSTTKTPEDLNHSRRVFTLEIVHVFRLDSNRERLRKQLNFKRSHPAAPRGLTGHQSGRARTYWRAIRP